MRCAGGEIQEPKHKDTSQGADGALVAARDRDTSERNGQHPRNIDGGRHRAQASAMLHNGAPRAVRLDGQQEAGVGNETEDGGSVRSTNKLVEPLPQDETSVRDVQLIQLGIVANCRVNRTRTP